MEIGVLTDGAFSATFGDWLSLLTEGAFFGFAEAEEGVIYIPSIPPYTTPVIIRRPLWVPKSETIPLVFIVWNQLHDKKIFNFEIWDRKYDYVDKLIKVYEHIHDDIQIKLTAYDIYILTELIDGGADIKELLTNGEIFRDENLGWMIINDK